MRMGFVRGGIGLLILLSSVVSSRAVVVNQLDDFEDGTTFGWMEGASENPPEAVPGGGPDGAEDGYLENISSGAGFGGGRMVMFNTAQWAGDYLSEGIVRIEADMANFGEGPLYMRIALGNANTLGATWYSSAAAVELPADGLWTPVSFGLASDDMVCVNSCGGPSFEELLGGAGVLRILSAELAPAFQGDVVSGRLGVDNIRAVGDDLIGDLDCDGDVDFDDIEAFVLGLSDPVAYEQRFGMPPAVKGDTEGDGDFDFDDIPLFVALLSPQSAVVAAVPEPSAWRLATLAALTLVAVYLRRSSGRFSVRREWAAF